MLFNVPNFTRSFMWLCSLHHSLSKTFTRDDTSWFWVSLYFVLFLLFILLLKYAIWLFFKNSFCDQRATDTPNNFKYYMNKLASIQHFLLIYTLASWNSFYLNNTPTCLCLDQVTSCVNMPLFAIQLCGVWNT